MTSSRKVWSMICHSCRIEFYSISILKSYKNCTMGRSIQGLLSVSWRSLFYINLGSRLVITEHFHTHNGPMTLDHLSASSHALRTTTYDCVKNQSETWILLLIRWSSLVPRCSLPVPRSLRVLRARSLERERLGTRLGWRSIKRQNKINQLWE